MNLEEVNHDELYRELFTPLFRYFLFRTRDYNLANDLVQTVFLKFFSHDYQDREKEHNTRALFMMARNTLIDHYRVSSKKQHISLENSGIDFPANTPTPFEEFRTNEDTLLVKEAIASLDEIDQDIVMLRITTDMGYKDISELVGESIDNVRQKYSRALKKIKAYLENKNIYG